RVVGDLRRRRRDRADQGALAGIGKAQQADVGQQLQLQPQLALLARQTRQGLARSAVGRALALHVAEAALATLGHQLAVAMRGHVADHLVGTDVGDHGADRNGDDQVLAGLAVHLPAHAVLPALGAELALVAEVDQGVEVLAGPQPYAAVIAAIAAVGPAERDELLAPETDAAVAAVACADLDFGFVYEFHGVMVSIGRAGDAAGAETKSPAEAGPS